MPPTVAFLAALALSLVLTPQVLKYSSRLGLYDEPGDARRIHRARVPRLGGVALVGSLALVIGIGAAGGAFAGADHVTLVGLGLGSLLLFVGGVYDDLHGLRPRSKLVLQVAAALIVFVLGTRVEVLSLGSHLEVQLGILSLPVTLGWIIFVTNAFNLIDGLDGLAAGIGIIAATAILFMANMLGHGAVVLVAAALAGSLMGFLRHNFSPARIFLGDCGSLFTGFLLAVLSIHGSTKGTAAVVVAVPLLTLALPILDSVVAVGRRWLRGTPVFAADSRHIHHRLLAMGLDQGRAALILYAVAASFAGVGLAMALMPPSTATGVGLAGGAAALALALYGMRRLDYIEFLEAGTVLSSGPGRFRRVIRDQIAARDLAARILAAERLAEVRELLVRHAGAFGFLAMDLLDDDSTHAAAPVHGAWRLEFPVSVPGRPGARLSISCGVDTGSRPYGAERVARILAPAITIRLEGLRKGEIGEVTSVRALHRPAHSNASTTSLKEPYLRSKVPRLRAGP